MSVLALLWLLIGSADAATLSLKTSDGASVAADAQGTGASGVVLVHGDGRTRADWVEVAASLARKGHQVVAVDLRAKGASWSTLDDAGRAAMVQDVAAAAAWLRGHGAKTITLVGADAGAVVTLAAGAADPAVNNLVLISPRLSLPGLSLTSALSGWGARPVLLVAATGDATGARAAAAIAEKATGRSKVTLVDGATVGAALVRQDAVIEGTIAGWISTGGVDGTGASAAAVKAATASEVETTGTRIGEDR
jgi:pimeloyl-ACP methyl ester carboxylesterase